MRTPRLPAAVLVLASLLLARTASAADAPLYAPWGLDLSAMDTGVRPGEDFNRYASGAWLARTTIPADQTIVSLRMQQTERIRGRLHELLEAAQEADPASVSGKVGAFYRSYLDEARLQQLGATPIQGELAAIRAARSTHAQARLMGSAPAALFGTLFNVGIDVDLHDVDHYAVYLGQGGLGLGQREYYLEDAFAGQRAAYRDYIERLLALLAWPDPGAHASAILAFETRIARASWPLAAQRDLLAMYNPVSRAALKALAPGFDWDAFLAAAGLGSSGRLIVQQKSAIASLAKIYRATPLDTLRAWQAFTVADNAAFYLSAPFAAARFEMRGHQLLGQQAQAPRWQRAIQAVGSNECLGDRVDCFGNVSFALGQMYSARYFPPQAKASIEALVANVRAAMRARLERLDWMSEETRREALAKLDTYQVKVGYPEHPRDFGGLELRADDLLGNVRRAAAWDWQFQRGRLGGSVDRSDWLIAPQINDAYNGELRDIVFPAGFLQPPVFDPAADAAVNYGAIGAMIGHELTHGFDDEGRKLDAKGNLRNWWNERDEAQFRQRAARLGAQYASYEPVPGVHVNGELTMGENIADLGGLNVALEAYRRSLGGQPAPLLDGLSGEQRFFLGWAQAWRGKPSEQFLRNQVISDPHSPRFFRVIGPVRNIDAWYEAFGVSASDRYYLAPDQRVRIW